MPPSLLDIINHLFPKINNYIHLGNTQQHKKRQAHTSRLPQSAGSVADQFCIDYFFYTLSDAVHPLHPFQLIFGLQFLRYALAGGVLLDQQIGHLIGRPVDLLQVGVQSAAEQQPGV